MSPMTLQAAAERLSQAIMNIPCKESGKASDYDWDLAYAYGHRDARHAAAELVLAQAADDGELLTAEWLRSVATPSKLSEAVYGYWLEGMGISINVCRDSRSRWMVELNQDDARIALGEYKTRGDIRTLCRAIGLELKEPTNA